jgi:ABC-2 type transport system ATP-binding protein
MADVVALCRRVIVIHRGRILYDGGLSQLAEQLAPFKLVRVTLADGGNGSASAPALPDGVDVLESQNGTMVLRVRRPAAPAVTAHLLQTLPVTDLTVEDPPLEAVIDQIYREGAL